MNHRMACSTIHLSMLIHLLLYIYWSHLSVTAQGSSTQGGHVNNDALNNTALHFGNKKKQSETEKDTYAVVSKPKLPKKKKQETLELYENLGKARVKSPNPLNYDTDTSEDEREVNYTQVTFNVKQGHQRANTDTREDEREVNYTQVKFKAKQGHQRANTGTSEDEGEVNYTKVTFNPKQGHQRANTDTSSSDEEYVTQYSEVKI